MITYIFHSFVFEHIFNGNKHNFSTNFLSTPPPFKKISNCLSFVIHLFTFSSSQTWHKPSLGEGIQICSFEGPCIPLYQRDEIAKIHLRHLKIFSRTTVPILINLGTKYPLAKGINFHVKNNSILQKEVMILC